MMTGLKVGFFLILISGFIFQANQLLNWRSPDVNMAGERDIAKYIDQDENKLHFELINQNNVRFCVDLVKNCGFDAINPYFPAISIKTMPECNAWLHIVRTDCQEPKYRTFIDAPASGGQYSTYPFYSKLSYFSDAPLWSYGLFWKPLSFWKGHAFAIILDEEGKTIKCLGGVEWGFELHWTKLRPVAILPKLLGEQAWLDACALLCKKLPDYKIL